MAPRTSPVPCFWARRPTKVQRDRFTRVLKGHIALGRAVFPEGVRGMRLDTLARVPLWEAGLDYKHGTGHGVGAFLNVHEGPISINPARDIGVPLEAGNILSNEPGYYEDGAYGIRIENLVAVQPASEFSKGTSFLRFENAHPVSHRHPLGGAQPIDPGGAQMAQRLPQDRTQEALAPVVGCGSALVAEGDQGDLSGHGENPQRVECGLDSLPARSK